MPASNLSGKLASELTRTGNVYVMDEPTTGLQPSSPRARRRPSPLTTRQERGADAHRPPKFRRGSNGTLARPPAPAGRVSAETSRGAGRPCRRRSRRLAGGRPCGGGRCGYRHCRRRGRQKIRQPRQGFLPAPARTRWRHPRTGAPARGGAAHRQGNAITDTDAQAADARSSSTHGHVCCDPIHLARHQLLQTTARWLAATATRREVRQVWFRALRAGGRQQVNPAGLRRRPVMPNNIRWDTFDACPSIWSASAAAPPTSSGTKTTRREAGCRRRPVEPLQGLEALVDLAEGDLDGSQAVVHAAEVGADIGVVGGVVGLDGGDRCTQVVDAGVEAGELRGEQPAEGDVRCDDGSDDGFGVGTHGLCAVFPTITSFGAAAKCNHVRRVAPSAPERADVHRYLDGEWSCETVTAGALDPWPRSGSSEVEVGRLGKRDFVATIASLSGPAAEPPEYRGPWPAPSRLGSEAARWSPSASSARR